jgi:hypothetical protein
VPDEAMLVGTVPQVRGISRIGERLGTAEAKQPAVAAALRILREQDRVLTGRLTNQGVPSQVIDAPGPLDPTAHGGVGASTGPTAGSTDGSAQATRTDLASALAAEPASEWTTMAAATEGNRLLLLSAASSRFASATVLGLQLTLPARGSLPVRTVLAERTAALVYAFEVAAAHSAGKQRELTLSTLGALRDLFDELGPLGQGFDLPGGWSLPFPVRTAADGERLGAEVLRRAISGTTTVRPADSGEGLADVAVWSGRLQALGTEHGIALTPFPGTTEGGAG